MHEITFDEALDLILATDARYHREAYGFVREGLDHTQKTIARDSRGRLRHVSGQELLEGIREYALEQFGPMTITLFEHWGIRQCQDFGEIVFNMVEIGLLAKTEKDSRSDFKDCYDFQTAFRKPFLPPSRQTQPEEAPASTTGR